MYAGKAAAVVGSDDWAAQETIELAQFADRVTLVSPDAPTWSRRRGERLMDTSNIDVREGLSVVALKGDSTLDSLELSDGTLIPAAGVFPYGGKVPNSGWLPQSLSEGGAIPVDSSLATPIAGVFGAGDVRDGAAQFVAASIGDGLTAGRGAVAYLWSSR